MYLVIGSTGNVGSQVVAQLAGAGEQVRAFVRTGSHEAPQPDGVETAVGDLDDVESLVSAARGVEGVFFMQAEPAVAQAENMVRAARAAHVSKIAVLSSIGTRLHPMPVIATRIEARDDVLQRSGLAVTFLRANTLMTNALWWAPSIREEGCVRDASDPGRTAPIDPFDLARVAALVLTQPGHAGHGYILGGPQALTAREQVADLAEVLGRPIDFVALTPEQLAQESVKRGTPAEMAEAMRDLNEHVRTGQSGLLTDDVSNLTGTAPRTFKAWCVEHAEAFRTA